MSNIIDLNELKQRYEAISKPKDLRAFIEAQQDIILKLQKELAFVKEKLNDAEKFLKASKLSTITPEEMICIEQIDYIKKSSFGRELTLDEVKRLDLLVKNLRLIREQSTQVINAAAYEHIREDELLAIATKGD
jgi:hypothetical protein